MQRKVRPLRRRFDDELIGLLLELKWWNRSPEEIQRLIPVLTDSNLEYVKNRLKGILYDNESV